MNQLRELTGNDIQLQQHRGLDVFDQPTAGGIDFVGIAARRRWILIFGALIGIGLGYIYLLQADSVYESTARVLVQTKQQVMPLSMDMIGADYGNASNHPIIIKSPRILIDSYEKRQLARLSSFAEKEEPIKFLDEKLNVVPFDQAPDVFDIKFRGPDPDDTRTIVAAIVATYEEFLQAKYADSSNETREMFLNLRDRYSKELNDLETRIQEFQETAPRFFRDGGETVTLPERHQQMYDNERLSLIQKITETKSKISAANTALKNNENLEGVLINAGDQARERTKALEDRRQLIMRDRFVPLMLLHEQLTSRYGKDHPEVISVRRQMERFRHFFPNIDSKSPDSNDTKEIRKLVSDYISSLKLLLAEQTAQLKEIEALYLGEEEAARKLAVFKAKNDALIAQKERTQIAYDKVVNDLFQLGVAGNEDFEGYKYSLLGPPSIGEKVAPMPLKIFPVSAVLGLMAGFGIAYLVDTSDKAFRTPDEVSSVLQLPLVGHVPLIDTEQVSTLPGSTLQPVLITVHKPKSPQAESYRAVRTALYFNNRDAQHQVIQVTSPMPGDGKSTLASNLAVTIAQSGKSVLLLDADFRRPTLHKVFGLNKPSKGLAGVVKGDLDPADVEISFPECPNLKFMACGTRPDNPSELLSSQKFSDTLQMFREQFDFVVVDTPPVLAVSDPGAVAARVDGVILTFRIHKRARPLATRARDALLDIGANIFGVVVNGIDQNAGGYYSQYRYGYGGYRYAYNQRYGYGQYGSEKSESKAINSYFDEDRVQAPTASKSINDNMTT